MTFAKYISLLLAIQNHILMTFISNKPSELSQCKDLQTTYSHTMKPFENTVGKEEIAFSFTHCVFFLFRELSIFIKFKIVVCRLFQFGTVFPFFLLFSVLFTHNVFTRRLSTVKKKMLITSVPLLPFFALTHTNPVLGLQMQK